jgi:GT2 family glycosyltransferase/glycosyltransferase involved in cell wall biosynthesis
MSAPLFSILTPVHETALDALRQCIDSVRSQRFTDWQWTLVHDRSASDSVGALLHAAAQQDPRISVIEHAESGKLVAASNDAIAAATGEFVALVDQGDLLTIDALERVTAAVEQFSNVDYVYSDEDQIDQHGSLSKAFRKPDWSPERLRGQMYTGHLSVIRRLLVAEVGGFREGFDGSEFFDLVLRVTEQARRIMHIPHVLYHSRLVEGAVAGEVFAKGDAPESGLRAVQEQADRLQLNGRARLVNSNPSLYRLTRDLRQDLRVSIIIPTTGTSARVWGEERCFVVEAVRSALANTRHQNLEIVVVYDPPTPSNVLAQLRDIAADKLVLVPYSGDLDFSKKMNLGVIASTGERIVTLNDNTQIRSQGWLEELVAPLDEPDVGMTGAKLYFSDGTIEHAGHNYSLGGYNLVWTSSPNDDLGPFGALKVNRECSGVSAACAALRREVFEEVGGFSETLPVNFNDVDLSYKLRFSGYRILWMASCELYHLGLRSKVRSVESWEFTRAVSRWGLPQQDPYLPVPEPLTSLG